MRWRCAGGRARRVGCAVVAATAAAFGAQADPAGVVNALRERGCGGVRPAGELAQRNGALDAVARELARGRTLADALARAGYPAARSSSFHVRGSRDEAAIRGLLEARYCADINDPDFRELGVHASGDETWIVMAGRLEPPFAAVQDPAAVAARVLELVNAARAQARRCGRQRFAAAPPLTMSTALMAAASVHALDMAERGWLGHEGSDGSFVADRVARTGYAWQGVGENVAAGQRDADAAVAAWLESVGHCATLMDPRFAETGVAFALAPGKNPAIYWAQVFATPR
jgi:uncharacterized protein YkwD